jgi:hypothetical protein
MLIHILPIISILLFAGVCLYLFHLNNEKADLLEQKDKQIQYKAKQLENLRVLTNELIEQLEHCEDQQKD